MPPLYSIDDFRNKFGPLRRIFQFLFTKLPVLYKIQTPLATSLKYLTFLKHNIFRLYNDSGFQTNDQFL